MKDNNQLEKIGEIFGAEIASLVSTNRAFTVTILDVGEKYASVTMTGSKEAMTVPLTGMSINFGYLNFVPALDSLAIVALADGSENAPFFLGFAELDELTVTVGESTMRVDKDVWEFNGGTLGGVTIAQELKTQLDKNNQLLQKLITIISGAQIPEAGNGAPSALQAALASAIAGLTLGEFTGIENTKITQ